MRELIKKLRISLTTLPDEIVSGRSELIGSVFFIFISLLLTTVNVTKHVGATMTLATTFLAIGFTLSALLAYLKKLTASRVLILILCGATFTMFAFTGGNDGFAILWILLVPIIGCIWVGLKAGIILSIYFQLFLIVLFYTPLSQAVESYYTSTFMLRFPMLYLASFGSITILMVQRESLYKKLHIASYYDALTGLHNRRYCSEVAEKIKSRELDSDFLYFSFDLNRLKYANDNFGHQAGDELLKAAADIIKRNFKDANCFRTGGDEFTAFASGIDPQKVIASMKEDCAAWKGNYMHTISISVGYASVSENPELSFDELALLADKRMYADKSEFYKSSGFDRRK